MSARVRWQARANQPPTRTLRPLLLGGLAPPAVTTFSLLNGVEGTNATTLTGGSGGNTTTDGDYFDAINTSGTAPDGLTFDTGVFHGGASSAKFDSTNTGNEYVEWSTQMPDNTSGTFFARCYLYIGAYPTGSNSKLIRLLDSTATEAANVTLNTTGTLRTIDSVANQGGLTTTLSLNTWYRVECSFPLSASGTLLLRLFYGANLEGTTPDEETNNTSADTQTATGDFASVRFGNTGIGAVTYMDDFGASNITWLGPRAPATSYAPVDPFMMAGFFGG